MNTNFSGAVLLLILAAAGLTTGNPPVYILAAVTAAFAFVADDLVSGEYPPSRLAYNAAWLFALASWGTTVAAFFFLLIN